VLTLVRTAKSPLQFILVGDFFQLPPVATDNEDVKYLFEYDIWKTLDFQCINLDGWNTANFRQKSAGSFTDCLKMLRIGSTNAALNELILGFDSEHNFANGTFVKLFATNEKCHEYNVEQLNQIAGESRTYISNVSAG
jgi:hypothetical protein